MSEQTDYFFTFAGDHSYRRHFVLLKAFTVDSAIKGFVEHHGRCAYMVFTQDGFYSNQSRLSLTHLSTIVETMEGKFEAEIKDRIFTAAPAEGRPHG